MNTKLSICIPTYNRASLLKKALNSILPQIEHNIVEVVVSDNASTDNTQKVVQEIRERYPSVKYYRNEENIGLDGNALISIERASGEYCWLCSDDDIILSGVVSKIISVINNYLPPLIYLNYAGFLDGEDYNVVFERNEDKQDIIYYDGQKMLRDLLLNHFSATVIKRSLALKYFNIVEEYKLAGFTRGYSLAISHYVVLENRGPFVFIGKLCVAVRNPMLGDYNPATSIIDTAVHYQLLYKKGLINKYTEKFQIRRFLRMSYKGILSTKCRNMQWYNRDYDRTIINFARKYDKFYFYIYPFFLHILPRCVLIVPYFAGCKIKAGARKIFNLSPF